MWIAGKCWHAFIKLTASANTLVGKIAIIVFEFYTHETIISGLAEALATT